MSEKVKIILREIDNMIVVSIRILLDGNPHESLLEVLYVGFSGMYTQKR